MAAQLLGWTATLLWAVLPFGVVMLALAVVSALATGGWTWTLKPLGPRFGAIDPLAGLGRVFSKQQVVDAFKASVLALVLGSIGAFWLAGHVRELVGVQRCRSRRRCRRGSDARRGNGLHPARPGGVRRRRRAAAEALFAERMKMSHQELKQEQKELDGNAEVKGKVRARMREMTRRRMMAAVPKADLVVMNPTHYAVALKYDDKTMGAPRVVAKGADLLALRIRTLAEESSVPVLETPVLARALYAHAELDREIPAALFAAVAQVLAYVYQLRAALRGQVPMPGELPSIDVPVELDPHFA
jgi:Flagellar biosynthesis pathway, component FlhB